MKIRLPNVSAVPDGAMKAVRSPAALVLRGRGHTNNGRAARIRRSSVAALTLGAVMFVTSCGLEQASSGLAESSTGGDVTPIDQDISTTSSSSTTSPSTTSPTNEVTTSTSPDPTPTTGRPDPTTTTSTSTTRPPPPPCNELYPGSFEVGATGECWSCPSGYQHDQNQSAAAPSACFRQVAEAATQVRRASSCGSGEFWDLYPDTIFNGGPGFCYTCPGGIAHNVFPHVEAADKCTGVAESAAGFQGSRAQWESSSA